MTLFDFSDEFYTTPIMFYSGFFLGVSVTLILQTQTMPKRYKNYEKFLKRYPNFKSL